MAHTYDERRRTRYVKGMRRLREDRAQHGADHRCACFNPDGRTFARFADYPAVCSGWCCGNQRTVEGPTRQERRAATADDWS